MKPEVYKIRDITCRAAREFFFDEGYTEVETPVRLTVPAQETHIDAVRCDGGYLRTSPEFHMKRLLADGLERIFQIGPCFRHGEKGRLHNPEFTMLEWYHAGWDYEDIMKQTDRLVRHIARRVLGCEVLHKSDSAIDLSREWHVVTVSQAFMEYAGWDPVTHYDADRFDLDLVSKVEPALLLDRPIVIKDFPVEASAFARIRGGNKPVAERWELYIGGIELANAYSELIDAEEQRERLVRIAEQRRRLGKDVYSQDESFLDALERGIPDCAGVALGLDRLVMLLSGAQDMAEVRPFIKM